MGLWDLIHALNNYDLNESIICSSYDTMINVIDMLMTYVFPLSWKWYFNFKNSMHSTKISFLTCFYGFHTWVSYFVHFSTNPCFSYIFLKCRVKFWGWTSLWLKLGFAYSPILLVNPHDLRTYVIFLVHLFYLLFGRFCIGCDPILFRYSNIWLLRKFYTSDFIDEKFALENDFLLVLF